MTEQVSTSAANGRKVKTNGKLIGAFFDKKNNRYMSCTKRNGKFVFLGYYNTEIEAHRKYLEFWKEVNETKEILPENTKRCSKCGKIKDFSLFHKNKSSPDGHYSWCSDCKSKNWKEKYKENEKTRKRNYAREYVKRKLKTDVNFKLKHYLRKRLRSALKGNFKNGSAISTLGCVAQELKIYLESKFYPNPSTGEIMSWENWGIGDNKWQIDHIIELHSVDLTDVDMINIVCHYSNLQPLWHSDHITKTKMKLEYEHNIH